MFVAFCSSESAESNNMATASVFLFPECISLVRVFSDISGLIPNEEEHTTSLGRLPSAEAPS